MGREDEQWSTLSEVAGRNGERERERRRKGGREKKGETTKRSGAGEKEGGMGRETLETQDTETHTRKRKNETKDERRERTRMGEMAEGKSDREQQGATKETDDKPGTMGEK